MLVADGLLVMNWSQKKNPTSEVGHDGRAYGGLLRASQTRLGVFAHEAVAQVAERQRRGVLRPLDDAERREASIIDAQRRICAEPLANLVRLRPRATEEIPCTGKGPHARSARPGIEPSRITRCWPALRLRRCIWPSVSIWSQDAVYRFST